MSEPYSYHTFILPFVWKTQGKKVQQNLENFAGIFDSNPAWETQDIGQGLEPGGKLPARFNGNDRQEEARLFYNEYQYFYPHVRNALYGFDHKVVRNFSFCPKKVHNKALYILTIHGEHPKNQAEDTNYELQINAINLMIYNTGIALFILECENCCIDSQRNLAAVKAINDLGRRINMPFIPVPGKSISICADIQTVTISSEESQLSFSSDFYNYVQNQTTSIDFLQNSSVTYISHFIKEILSYGQDEYRFTSDQNKAKVKKNQLYIRPALDERMFVLCCISDQEMTNQFLGEDPGTEEKVLPFMTDRELQKSLYELVFVDTDGDCSCQSSSMRETLLKKHVYSRWFGSNSIYTISDQSVIYLAADPKPHLINSFLCHYNQMTALALAQRASLELFETEMSALSIDSMGRKNRRIRRKAITRIMSLRQRFITYQSQLGFSEVSSQQQGIEMWEMLRSSCGIQKRTKSLSKRLEALHEAADTDLSYSLNILGVVIALLTGVDILNGLLGGQSASEWVFSCLATEGKIWGLPVHTFYLIITVAILAIGISLILWFFRRRK